MITPAKPQQRGDEEKHVISVLVENKFGVLSRVAGGFAGRGFNIDSLNVGETRNPAISRMTIVVRGDEDVLDQVKKQLNRLVDVINVQDFTHEEYVDRELILVKVKSGSDTRSEIVQIADIFRARIVDVKPDNLVLEATGAPGKINAILDMLKPFGIMEFVRSGRVAMARGERTIYPEEMDLEAS